MVNKCFRIKFDKQAWSDLKKKQRGKQVINSFDFQKVPNIKGLSGHNLMKQLIQVQSAGGGKSVVWQKVQNWKKEPSLH